MPHVSLNSKTRGVPPLKFSTRDIFMVFEEDDGRIRLTISPHTEFTLILSGDTFTTEYNEPCPEGHVDQRPYWTLESPEVAQKVRNNCLPM
jgi:hypothetical protein